MKPYMAIVLIGLMLSGTAFHSTAQNEKQEAYFSDRIEKQWETKPRLKTPECVYFDQEREQLYVSNINGKPDEAANNGFISKLDLEGNIMKLKWVKGLNAPKGMDVHDGKLYVGDVGAIVEIDIDKGEIVKRYKTPESKFLNDIAIDENGTVYCSDMYANKIYRIKDGKAEVWLEHENLERPNGVLVEKGNLLVGNSDHILRVQLKTKEAGILVKNTGSIDGLQSTNEGYLITDWKGRTHLVGPEREKELLMNTIPLNQNAADLGYNATQRILYIPTFKNNRVVAYQLR